VPAVAQDQPGSLLFAWLKDNDAEDPAFLAVIDADPESASYGKLLTTRPTEDPLSDAHHTPHQLPSNNRIFANAFRDGKTFIYDISEPLLPQLIGGFDRIGEYGFPHSFVELPGGNFLVTFQSSGEDDSRPGGLLELTPDGEQVRAASAADPSATDFIRPYSLEIFTGQDRIISSSADMWQTQATEHLQLWRLSDLALLDTIALPEGDRRNIHQIPLEIRPVGDGSSAYVITWNCGIYHLTGFGGRSLSARLVWDFNANACAIPLRIGNYWIQAVGGNDQLVVLDIEDPARPELATVVSLPDGFQPHWMSAEPNGTRIVLTGYGALSDRIVMLNWEARVEHLSVVDGFGQPDEDLPGFFTNRSIWPHGKTGEATAHGVMFWPPAANPDN
jgi:hypothetical protein